MKKNINCVVDRSKFPTQVDPRTTDDDHYLYLDDPENALSNSITVDEDSATYIIDFKGG